MKHETGYFEGRETRKLFYQIWKPDSGDIEAFVVAIHDLAGHSDRMRVPAESFTEKGFALFSFDLRGHWRNIGDFPGHIDSIDHVEKDIVLFMDVVRRDAGDKKIFLLGQSFGGLICLIHAIRHPDLPGVIILSPLLGLSEKMSFGKKMTKKITAKFSPEKMVQFVIDQKDLTSDLKILRGFIADKNKLEGISAKTFVELHKSARWVMENAPKLMCPIIVCQAGKERISDKEKTKKFFEEIESLDKTYVEYDGFLHELLNEKKRATVFQDIFIFIQKHL